MNKSSLESTTAPATTPAVIHPVHKLVEQLHPRRLEKLAMYAGSIFARCGRQPSRARYVAVYDGPEIVHDVIAAVLLGTASPHHGRHPRPQDLADLDAFEHYLRGAIQSECSTLTRHSEANVPHIPLDACSEEQESALLQPSSDPAWEAEHADLARVAFQALRSQLARADSIGQALALWEEHLPHISRAFELGLTPRRYRDLRKRLRRIFRRLDFAPVSPSHAAQEVAI